MKTSTRICKPSTKVFLFFSRRIYFLNIRKQEIKVLVVAYEIVSDVFAKVCRNILNNVFYTCIHLFLRNSSKNCNSKFISADARWQIHAEVGS